MNDDETIRKVYETYSHLSDDDIIERLAMLTTEDEENTLIIEDTEINDEWKNLSKRTSYITNKYYKIESLYKIIVGDIADFNKHFKYIKNDYNEVKKDDFVESNVIRHFIHILSSSVMFVTYLENLTKEYYGKNSEEFNKLKQYLSQYYDNEFVYRFMYELRNYAHHKEIPIHTMSYSIDEASKSSVNVVAEIDTTVLKNSGYRWKKVFLKDFSELDEKLNVHEIVYKYFNILALIFGRVNEIYFDVDIDNILTLKKELENYQESPNKLYISKISKYNLAYNPSHHSITPFTGLYEIDELMLYLSKIGLVKIK